jgi:hypothetical protein
LPDCGNPLIRGVGTKSHKPTDVSLTISTNVFLLAAGMRRDDGPDTIHSQRIAIKSDQVDGSPPLQRAAFTRDAYRSTEERYAVAIHNRHDFQPPFRAWWLRSSHLPLGYRTGCIDEALFFVQCAALAKLVAVGCLFGPFLLSADAQRQDQMQ